MANEPDAGGAADEIVRELIHELFDMGIAIDLIGQATASRIGINQTDLICLDLLHRQGPISAGQMAAALGLTTAAISAMAARLEAAGYARREMDPADRRRVLLHASPSGIKQTWSLYDRFYAATAKLTAAYPEPDVRMLLDLLGRFRQLITDEAAAMRADVNR